MTKTSRYNRPVLGSFLVPEDIIFGDGVRGPCFFWSPTLFIDLLRVFFDPSWMKSWMKLYFWPWGLPCTTSGRQTKMDVQLSAMSDSLHVKRRWMWDCATPATQNEGGCEIVPCVLNYCMLSLCVWSYCTLSLCVKFVCMWSCCMSVCVKLLYVKFVWSYCMLSLCVKLLCVSVCEVIVC